MTKIVRACAEIAKERGHPVFGIKFYRECWSRLDAENTYNKYGPSQNCWEGVGRNLLCVQNMIKIYFFFKLRVKYLT